MTENKKRATHPADAISQVLQAYTKRKNAENDFNTKLNLMRLKNDNNYAKQIMMAGARQKAIEARQKHMEIFKKQQLAPFEKKYAELSQIKATRDFSPVEQAQFNIVQKKLGISPTKIEEPTQSERKIIGALKAMMEGNESLSDIHEYLKYKGYNSGDFSDILEGYSPKPKKSAFDTFKNVTLPSAITKVSEALKYLTGKHKMSEPEAKKWLKTNMEA